MPEDKIRLEIFIPVIARLEIEIDASHLTDGCELNPNMSEGELGAFYDEYARHLGATHLSFTPGATTPGLLKAWPTRARLLTDVDQQLANHPAAVLLGEGWLNWFKYEREGERYGTVHLSADQKDRTTHLDFAGAPVDTMGTLVAVLLETSRNVGPPVGTVLWLGAGELFAEHNDYYGITAIGMRPRDGRTTHWLNYPSLHDAHNRKVRLLFLPCVQDVNETPPQRYYVLGDKVSGPFRYDEKAGRTTREMFGGETPYRVMATSREDAIQKGREAAEQSASES